MSGNPAVLALHFLLELAALAVLTYWGWTAHQGAGRVAWAVGLPLTVATAWAVFRVPGDPADAVIAVPGLARLLFELLVLDGAVGPLVPLTARRSPWSSVCSSLSTTSRPMTASAGC